MIVALREDSLYVGHSFAGTCQTKLFIHESSLLGKPRWGGKSVFLQWVVTGSSRWKGTNITAPLFLGWPSQFIHRQTNLVRLNLDMDYVRTCSIQHWKAFWILLEFLQWKDEQQRYINDRAICSHGNHPGTMQRGAARAGNILSKEPQRMLELSCPSRTSRNFHAIRFLREKGDG